MSAIFDWLLTLIRRYWYTVIRGGCGVIRASCVRYSVVTPSLVDYMIHSNSHNVNEYPFAVSQALTDS